MKIDEMILASKELSDVIHISADSVPSLTANVVAMQWLMTAEICQRLDIVAELLSSQPSKLEDGKVSKV